MVFIEVNIPYMDSMGYIPMALGAALLDMLNPDRPWSTGRPKSWRYAAAENLWECPMGE